MCNCDMIADLLARVPLANRSLLLQRSPTLLDVVVRGLLGGRNLSQTEWNDAVIDDDEVTYDYLIAFSQKRSRKSLKLTY